ncbi:MAG: hypothetical protein AAF333_18710 [Planctomycetota bacterium]
MADQASLKKKLREAHRLAEIHRAKSTELSKFWGWFYDQLSDLNPPGVVQAERESIGELSFFKASKHWTLRFKTCDDSASEPILNCAVPVKAAAVELALPLLDNIIEKQSMQIESVERALKQAEAIFGEDREGE